MILRMQNIWSGWITKYTVRVRDQRLLLAFYYTLKGEEEHEQSTK